MDVKLIDAESRRAADRSADQPGGLAARRVRLRDARAAIWARDRDGSYFGRIPPLG
ncbi:hypothetical protein ABZ639_24285 [Saccharomonospora sp. NPDC006951]